MPVKHMVLINNGKSNSIYRAGEVSIHRACCEWATQSYTLGGGWARVLRFVQAQNQQVTTRSPRIVTGC